MLSALACAVFLTGCGGDLGGIGATRSAPRAVAVAQGAVVIGGPPGYCVDRRASRLGGDAAFVVLANCAAITRRPEDAAARTQGLLTAAVAAGAPGGPGLLADPAALRAFLVSDAGRAAMARDGQAASVQVLDMAERDGAMLIRLRDTSQSDIAGVDAVYWRGLAELNGRLLTVSALSFADRPLGAGEGLSVLRAFLTRIRTASPGQAAEN